MYIHHFHVRWEMDAVKSLLFLLLIAHNIACMLMPMLVHLDSLELSFGLMPHLPVLHPPLAAAPLQVPIDPPPPLPSIHVCSPDAFVPRASQDGYTYLGGSSM